MHEGTDLFDQVAVSWPEVYAWCEQVAGIGADSPRLAWYVQAYDVVGKIARAKLAQQKIPRARRPGGTFRDS